MAFRPPARTSLQRGTAGSRTASVAARRLVVPRVSLLDAIVKPITTSGQVCALRLQRVMHVEDAALSAGYTQLPMCRQRTPGRW
jgi:hypothetical protein